MEIEEISKIVEKIKKVLALAGNNSNVHERETAMLKAQEMLFSYNLTMSDVNKFMDNSEQEKVVKDESVTDVGNLLWWEKNLSNVVAKNFRCEAIINHTFDKKSYISFIGLQEDVEIAKVVYDFANKSLKFFSEQYIIKMCNNMNLNVSMKDRPEKLRKFVNPKDFQGEKNDFITGFIHGVSSKYKEQVKHFEEKGLVVVQDKVVTDYMAGLHLKRGRSSQHQTSRSREHYNNGYKKGKNYEYTYGSVK